MAENFLVIVDTRSSATRDYSSQNAVETAITGDFTSALMRVYSHSGKTGTVGDGASVTGSVNGYAATVKHCTSDRILVLHDTASETFETGEQIQVDGSNYVTVTATIGSGAGDTAALRVKARGDLSNKDTTSVNWNGLTLSAANDLLVETDSDYRTKTTIPANGDYYVMALTGNAYIANQSYVTIEGLAIQGSYSGNSQWTVYCGNFKGIIFRELTIECDATGRTGCAALGTWGIGSGRTVTIFSNYIENAAGVGTNIIIDGGSTSGAVNIWNNTCIGGKYGVYNDGGSATCDLRNNVSWGSSGGAPYYSGDGWGTATHNAFDSGSDPGSSGVDLSGKTLTDIWIGAGDYHLAAVHSNPLYNTGTNLSTEEVTTDIDGEIRDYTGPWCIGCDEIWLKSIEDYRPQRRHLKNPRVLTPRRLR